MSLWRRIAIERLPELQCKIADADNAFDLWIELYNELNRIYQHEPDNESLIGRIYKYAAWCWNQSRNDYLRTAVIVCFYEVLPTDKVIRKDVARWLSVEEFAALRPVFGYYLSKKAVDEFAHEFSDRKQRLEAPTICR